jgi:hypothetical protein
VFAFGVHATIAGLILDIKVQIVQFEEPAPDPAPPGAAGLKGSGLSHDEHELT